MLSAKAATRGVLVKRDVLKNRFHESYQVKFPIKIFEKHLRGSSFLVKLQVSKKKFFIGIFPGFWLQISKHLFLHYLQFELGRRSLKLSKSL